MNGAEFLAPVLFLFGKITENGCTCDALIILEVFSSFMKRISITLCSIEVRNLNRYNLCNYLFFN